MNRLLLLVVAVSVLASLGEVGSAQSMWQHRHPNRIYMTADTKARHVGDLITVVISENTVVNNKDERAAEKDTEIGGVFNFSGSTTGNAGTNSAAAELDSMTTSRRTFDGSSEYKVARALSDHVTVQVLDVLPNGNLVIGGRRDQFIAGEKRSLLLSGVVRPYDLATDNSVDSRLVGSLRLTYDGKGPDSSFANQGWLGRITNKLWPF